MYRLENIVTWLFYILVAALGIIFIEAAIEIKTDWSSFGAYVRVVLSAVALFFAWGTIKYTVPAASVGIPESLILGRFKPESKNECGCSVPIAPATKEGFHFKKSHHKINIEERRTHTLIIPEQAYDIIEGDVLVSGLIQWRLSADCAYRRLEMSREEAEEGLSAVIDQVIVEELIKSELEVALQLKSGIKETIQATFDAPAMVDYLDEGKMINGPRTLGGKLVKFSSHNFAAEVTMVKIRDIRPNADIAAGRSNIVKEKLKGRQTEVRMARFKDINDKFKKMYPNLGEEKWSQLLKLAENLSTEEKKIFGIADLPEMKDLFVAAIPTLKGIIGGGSK